MTAQGEVGKFLLTERSLLTIHGRHTFVYHAHRRSVGLKLFQTNFSIHSIYGALGLSLGVVGLSHRGCGFVSR